MANTKKNQENNESRSNVILLTVIALATMIVVVIGATFAYLANSVQDIDSSSIGATTNGTADLFMINAGEDISISADNENFAADLGDVTDSSIATVTLKRAIEEATTYRYNIYVDVLANDFEYSSGTCYNALALTSDASKLDYANCTASPNNVWGTVDGSTYGCYTTADLGAALYMNGNATYSNEVTCIAQNNTVWGSTQTAELVMELYKSNDVSDAGTCASSGVCVNNAHEIVSGVTTQNVCEGTASNTWIPNVFEDGSCYSVVATKDLTEVRPQTTGSEELNNEVILLENAEITAGIQGKTDYYKAVVTLKNFNHNQIVNSNKTFNATLNFARVTDQP